MIPYLRMGAEDLLSEPFVLPATVPLRILNQLRTVHSNG